MDKYLLDKSGDMIAGTMEKTSQFMREKYAPAPDLNRKTWNKLNQTQDVVMFNNLATAYGRPRMRDFILEQQQRDSEER